MTATSAAPPEFGYCWITLKTSSRPMMDRPDSSGLPIVFPRADCCRRGAGHARHWSPPGWTWDMMVFIRLGRT